MTSAKPRRHIARTLGDPQSWLPEPGKKSWRPWLRVLAGFGFWAQGFLHIVVGTLAAMLAAGMGGEAESLGSALVEISGRPFGGVLVGILALGFVSLAGWRVVQAGWDPDGLGSSPMGLTLRAGCLSIGAFHLVLASKAARILWHGASGQDTEAESERVSAVTAWLLQQPWGRVVVGVVGVVITAFAITNVVRAVRARFRDNYARERMSPRIQSITTALGRAGFGARAMVLLAAAGLFFRAAWHASAEETGGMAKALSSLLEQPFGPTLLASTGTGLIAYGLFHWSMIRYRGFKLPGS